VTGACQITGNSPACSVIRAKDRPCPPPIPLTMFFRDVQDTYWSSTTNFFATDWAWALYLEKGAVGVGYKKETNFFVWPVAVF